MTLICSLLVIPTSIRYIFGSGLVDTKKKGRLRTVINATGKLPSTLLCVLDLK